MMKEKLETLIKDINPAIILEEKTPILRGDLDSYDLIQLVAGIEQTFQVQVSHDDVNDQNFNDFSTVLNFIQKKIR